METKKHTWLVLKIKGYYPVIPGKKDGPFYGPDPEWYYSPENREWVERIIASLKSQGHEASVSEVTR